MKKNQGFTLIELLVVIGIIGILAAIVLVAVNPGRQFAQARDTQRRSDLYALTNAIYQYAAEHDGNLPESRAVLFPDEWTCVGSAAAGCFDLADAGGTETIVPTYISALPTDPSTGTQENTQYSIMQDANGRVVATGSGEIAGIITVLR